MLRCRYNNFDTQQHGIPRTGDSGDGGHGFPLDGARFTVHADGTLTDSATGLQWIKDAWGLGGQFAAYSLTWAAAKTACGALTYAGYSDWRLPTAFELATLLDYGKSSAPTIDDVFDNIQTGSPGEPYPFLEWAYWSATDIDAANAAVVTFGTLMSALTFSAKTGDEFGYMCLPLPVREAYRD